MTIELLFWLLLLGVFYSYFGYGILLFFLIKIKRSFSSKPNKTFARLDDDSLPSVTFLVAAFNEEAWIDEKIRNSFALDYPKDKIFFFFVTDAVAIIEAPDRRLARFHPSFRQKPGCDLRKR